MGKENNPPIFSRLSVALSGIISNYGPTTPQIISFEITKKQYPDFEKQLKSIINVELPNIEKVLVENGASIVM